MRALGLAAALLGVTATAQAQSYVVVCTASCTAYDGTTQPAGTAINRVSAAPGFPITDGAGQASTVTLQPDTGQALYPPRDLGALAAQAAAAATAAAAYAPILSLSLSADKTHVIGNTSAGSLDPGSPQATCLATTGLVTNCKTWSGQVTTDTTGAFVFDYTNAGFTAPPRIRLQAMSTASQVYIAAPQMPTAIGDAGTVYAPAMTSTIGVLGAVLTLQPKAGAGVVVQLTANGS